ncbi:MAG TPA: hypothetical protein VMI33_09020 [Streptosporangiaceae bacterium]|nr:hypothetical protein [Streptosporangiaceae bacterium]HTS96750.1 hypothetical protein [Streptosporangiaceae bacterium]
MSRRPSGPAGPISRSGRWPSSPSGPAQSASGGPPPWPPAAPRYPQDDDHAEPLYQQAIAAHEGDGRPTEQARTRLLYGEWLRRNQRRADAR